MQSLDVDDAPVAVQPLPVRAAEPGAAPVVHVDDREPAAWSRTASPRSKVAVASPVGPPWLITISGGRSSAGRLRTPGSSAGRSARTPSDRRRSGTRSPRHRDVRPRRPPLALSRSTSTAREPRSRATRPGPGRSGAPATNAIASPSREIAGPVSNASNAAGRDRAARRSPDRAAPRRVHARVARTSTTMRPSARNANDAPPKTHCG